MEQWPDLPYTAWRETCQTLHLYTQIVGKVRMTFTPPINHWWHVPLYLTARGFTTSPIPYNTASFSVDFDFLDHQVNILTSTGARKSLPLIPRSVAAFYAEFMLSLHALGIHCELVTIPSEIPNGIPFEKDEEHHAYEPASVERFLQILLQTEQVLREFRSPFIGKSSPIHFFWGSFDLALTFFSGRRAPERPGADSITREAYSDEVISSGFWPGSDQFPEPAFYAYAAPKPTGFAQAKIRPPAAFWHEDMGEFILRYADIRQDAAPAQRLLEFFTSVYDAGATLGHWDRATLERPPSSHTA